MDEPSLTKRLHVSGLTPSISPDDLERRLSSFGKVKAMDGFGARDALGDPRKFGFVTMEIGAKELAKCLNVLSGSTWKGAKLRIGEAKLDFRERLAHMNSQPPKPVRPKRTRLRNYGYVSATLPLVPLSATVAASTPGWIATPSGRVVRPMRMRPERPLDPIRSMAKDKALTAKAKKRTKPPPLRARRRLIDPTKWDSVYLKGMFLEAIPAPMPTSREQVEHSRLVKRDVVGEEDDRETSEDDTSGDAFPTSFSLHCQLVQDSVSTTQTTQPSRDLSFASSSHQVNESISVRDEANAALAMLGEMFGDKEDWGERESAEEVDLSADNAARGQEMQANDNGDVEVVARDLADSESKKIFKSDSNRMTAGVRFAVDDDGAEDGLDRDIQMREGGPLVNVETPVHATPAKPVPETNLKTLFAPREDASFSLVDHLDLDLDLELDADILGIAPSGASQEDGQRSAQTSSTSQVGKIPATIPTTKSRPRVALDPALPLLFPRIDLLPHPYIPSPAPMTDHSTLSCLLFPSATRVRGLNHLPSSKTFSRTSDDTDESIRERWERDKSSLTHEWKKAWREARGSRRGGSGVRGENGGGY